MSQLITKSEYRLLKKEIREMREKIKRLEKIFHQTQKMLWEKELLERAQEAKILVKRGKLPLLKSLKELR